jgi:hypothetical protein
MSLNETLKITLGTGSYTSGKECVKHAGATAVESYTLVSGNTAGATLDGNELTITQPGTVKVTYTVTLGDQKKEATATFTITEKAASADQKTELTDAVASVKDNYAADSDKYTADSWKDVQDAIDAANALGADATESQVAAAKDAIAAAVAALVPASRGSLDDLKNSISGLKESDYTADSWKALQDALAAANALDANAGLTATDKAYNDLLAAKAGLTVKTADAGQTGTKNPTTNVTPAKKGEIKDDGIYSYRILDPDAKTVEVTGLKKTDLTKITVFSTVTLDGVTYKVTGVAAKAFKGNKKITAVTIKKGVTSIGKNAFAGCTKLKKVTVKSTTLKTIGAKAFYGCKSLKTNSLNKTKVINIVGKKAIKGINKKATIKVAKAKRAAYKKLLAKKGQASTVKIK